MFKGENWKPVYIKKYKERQMTMKSYHIYSNAGEERLRQYGFVKAYPDKNRYDLYNSKYNTSIALIIENSKVQIISASTPTIKTICEMYKNGDIYFEEYKRVKKSTMQLTPDEVELIREYRKEQS